MIWTFDSDDSSGCCFFFLMTVLMTRSRFWLNFAFWLLLLMVGLNSDSAGSHFWLSMSVLSLDSISRFVFLVLTSGF